MFENAKIRVHFPKTFLDQTLAKISWQTNQSAFSDPQLGNDATYALSLSKNVQLSQSQTFHSTAVSRRKNRKNKI